jgi:hypothetical protein
VNFQGKDAQGMAAKKQKIQRWATDPFCPIDWRFQDAGNLAAGKRLNWADDDDSLVVECAAYLKAMGSAASGPERVAVRARWLFIRAASELAEKGSLQRAEIQSRLLAGQTDEQIAEKCQVRPELVACFEQLFCAVRHALKATDYLITRTVGRAVQDGFKNDQVGEFWNWCALAGGVVALDFLVDRLRDVLGVDDQPTLMAYLGRRVPLPVQGFVAAHVLPFNEQMAGVWTECHSRVKKTKVSDADMEDRDIERRVLIRLAKAHLAGKRLPIKPVTVAPKSTEATTGTANGKRTACNAKRRKAPSLGDVNVLMAEMEVGAK